MKNNIRHADILTDFLEKLNSFKVDTWRDISNILNGFKSKYNKTGTNKDSNYLKEIESGISFITFDYGIDGVSIEIEKYALCLEKLFKGKNNTNVPLHFIGGDFHDKADTVLKSRWHRFQIPNSNGWSKWSDGKWFSKLFYEDMPEGSEVSELMAKEIWKQTVDFSIQLGGYLIENDIKLLIPVNICTNPGNPAIALAVVLVTELLGLKVLTSNHDFYWEGGKPDRSSNEDKGPRDHFFKNHTNKEFFELFENLFPWNGDKWLQVNINEPQTECLVEKFNFPKDKVYEIGSCISNEFLRIFKQDEVTTARRKMNYILSDGCEQITTTPINTYLDNLELWMKNQKPIVCSSEKSKNVDLTNPKTLYCLQPTRVVGRKRIYKDLKILTSLLKTNTLKELFLNNSDYQLILHITGPVPIEHQADLEDVLNAYKKLCHEVNNAISDRIYIAFSVGTEDHPALKPANLEKLCIEEIYRLADIILFPSETEGRGLPIIESGASGIPIVCSRYYPEEVFDGVIGTSLTLDEQIKYILFPEDDNYSSETLNEITTILLNPEYKRKYADHNRRAVSKRYGIDMLVDKFDFFIKKLTD
jgi:glycosyltransferase involved in cell wall biosynthesis